MLEVKIVRHAPGVAAFSNGIVGRKRISLTVLPMPISSVSACFANVGLVLRRIAVGLRSIGLDAIFRIARFHATRAAKVPHGNGGHGSSMRVAGEHIAGNAVIC